jgi:hypothetical protein
MSYWLLILELMNRWSAMGSGLRGSQSCQINAIVPKSALSRFMSGKAARKAALA